MTGAADNLVPFRPNTPHPGPLPEGEGGKGGRGAGPPGDAGGGDEELALAKLPLNDLGLAERLLARFGADLTATHEMGWGSWDGSRFYFENGEDIARRRAHDVARLMREKEWPAAQANPGAFPWVQEMDKWLARFYGFAVGAANAGKTDAMLRQAEPYLRRKLEEFDAQMDALTCANGTLHLAAGSAPVLRPHDRADAITKTTGVDFDPDARCPRFEAHMEKVQPDPELRAFVQRCLGYCLLGGNREQVFFIFQGRGGDGKSTTLNAVRRALGEYAASADISTFLFHESRGGSGPSPDIARLATGVRMVLTSEPEKGARLSGSLLKSISGGEPMVARKLQKEFFEFHPRWSLIISCNHKPYIGGDDGGIWRRTVVVPWPVQIPEDERDKSIDAALAREASGILRWLVDGYYDYFARDGLDPPAAAREALDDYRRGSNPFGEWYDERCVVEVGAREQSSELYRDYKDWCDKNGIEPVSQTSFGKTLADRQHTKTKSNGLTYRRGLRLRDGRD